MPALFAQLGTRDRAGRPLRRQPSHDWAASEPFTDFDVNAGGTLNLLEATRLHAPDATFIFTSTNKVYGDTPNALPLHRARDALGDRPGHRYADGIGEDMSIDGCLHSLFGASKVAADVMVQEYGRYFGLRTACFRGGTLTGPQHAGGRAARLPRLPDALRADRAASTRSSATRASRCATRSTAHDLVSAFDAFFRAPARRPRSTTSAAGALSNCSMLEAIALVPARSPAASSTGRTTRPTGSATTSGGSARMRRFAGHYPEWRQEYDVPRILHEIYTRSNAGARWHA